MADGEAGDPQQHLDGAHAIRVAEVVPSESLVILKPSVHNSNSDPTSICTCSGSPCLCMQGLLMPQPSLSLANRCSCLSLINPCMQPDQQLELMVDQQLAGGHAPEALVPLQRVFSGLTFVDSKPLCSWLSENSDGNVPARDTREYIVWCHQRVKSLNAIGGPRMCVVKGESLKSLGRLPRFPEDQATVVDWENVLEKWLAECDDEGKICGKRVVCAFISHRWLRPHYCDQCRLGVCLDTSAHPDDEDASKAKALIRFTETSEEVIDWHFWIDFAGVDQTDTQEKVAGIMKLPGYISCSEGCFLLVTPGYECRSWTRLERLIAYRRCPAYSFYVLTLDFPNPPDLTTLIPDAMLQTACDDKDTICLNINHPSGHDSHMTDTSDKKLIDALVKIVISTPMVKWADDESKWKDDNFAFGKSTQSLFFPNGVK